MTVRKGEPTPVSDATMEVIGEIAARAAARPDPQVDGLAKEAEYVRANISGWLPRFLLLHGMTRRELLATLDRIPAPLRAGVESESMEPLFRGEVPERGFGFCGPAGVGKTFALAAMFKAYVSARWTRLAPVRGRKATDTSFEWRRWPESVIQWRVASMRDGGHEEVLREVRMLASCEVLVLDDVGAERLRGSYDEDWSASMLDLIADQRYNDMLPTWFTSNLSTEKILDRYGARLFSRLCGENVPRELPAGPDLRLVR